MSTCNPKRRATAAALVLSLVFPALPALADGRPVRMIVPNAPGSSVDALARTRAIRWPSSWASRW